MQHNQDLKKVLAAIVKHSPGMVDRVCQERHWNLFLIGIKKISVPNFKKLGYSITIKYYFLLIIYLTIIYSSSLLSLVCIRSIESIIFLTVERILSTSDIKALIS
jgi:hypothetical protein